MTIDHYNKMLREYENMKEKFDGIEPILLLHPDEFKEIEICGYTFGFMGNVLAVYKGERVVMTMNTELNSWLEIQDMLVVRNIFVMLEFGNSREHKIIKELV